MILWTSCLQLRDQYDVRIRGVGRNFRALGGDPGVATYYNGIFSPDFGIAAGENYLFDVERIEVSREVPKVLFTEEIYWGCNKLHNIQAYF